MLNLFSRFMIMSNLIKSPNVLAVTPCFFKSHKNVFLEGVASPFLPNQISSFWSIRNKDSLEYREKVPEGGVNVIPFLNVYENEADVSLPLLACNGVDFQTPFGWLSGFLYALFISSLRGRRLGCQRSLFFA